MMDILPNAPRVVALRDDSGAPLGFAIRQAEKDADDRELFRAASMTPIIAWLELRYGPMRTQ